MFEAIILAGGHGTRLRSLVSGMPKPMAPVAGKPFLEIVLNHLLGKGIRRTILSVGYLYEVIESYFGDNFHAMKIDYARETVPLGTGGALRFAMQQCRDSVTLVLNGDTFLDFNINSALNEWREHRAPMIIGVQTQDTTRYGRLLVEGQRITGFLEKGESGPGIINAGSYIFPTDIFSGHDLPEAFSLEQDFLTHEVAKKTFRLVSTNGPFIDIGVPEDYLLAQKYLLHYAQQP